MVSLTLLELSDMSPGGFPIEQLLDIFKSAPCFCKIKLHRIALAAGSQGG